MQLLTTLDPYGTTPRREVDLMTGMRGSVDLVLYLWSVFKRKIESMYIYIYIIYQQ